MMWLTHVRLEDLDEGDLEYLSKAKEEELGGVSPIAFAEMIQSGRAMVWRFVGDVDERGIFVTTLSPEGEFFVWMFAGEGMLKHLHWIFERFQEIARHNQAKWITGIAKPALAWLYEKRLGFQRRNVQVVKEL